MKTRFQVSLLAALAVLLTVFQVATLAAPAKTKTETAATLPASQRIDLNTASKDELESLPGVGAATADAIINARPFKSVRELRDVAGVGDTRYEQLQGKVKVSRPPAASTEKAATPAPKTPADRAASKTAPERDAASNPKTTASPGTAASPHADGKVDLNTADRGALMALPGVGEATADAIIAARPFKTVEQLNEVKGIGAARFRELQPLVTVRTVRSRSNTATGRPATGTRETGRSATESDEKSVQTPPSILTPPAGSSTPAEERAARPTAPSSARQPAAEPSGGKVNINTASQAELEGLLGIGPVKAQAIIEGRPYKTVEEVMRVSGIKEGTFTKIQDRIVVK